MTATESIAGNDVDRSADPTIGTADGDGRPGPAPRDRRAGTRLELATLVVALLALPVAVAGMVAGSGLGPVLLVLSPHHGVHVGDLPVLGAGGTLWLAVLARLRRRLGE